MIPGTTPTNKFKVPLKKEMVSTVQIVYFQNGNEVLRKTTKDCEIEDNVITTRLTQEETLKFKNNQQIQIQLRILTPASDALASKPIKVDCDILLDRMVIK